MSNAPTLSIQTPPRPDESSTTPSPVRPTPPVVLPPVKRLVGIGLPMAPNGLRHNRVALQQVDRAELLRVINLAAATSDCHITSEVSWWEASARAERASVKRVRAERAAERAA